MTIRCVGGALYSSSYCGRCDDCDRYGHACLPLGEVDAPPRHNTITDAQLELMCRAHDAEDAAQCGEPSPWEKTLFDPITGIEYTDFRGDRIAAMRCAVEALADGFDHGNGSQNK